MSINNIYILFIVYFIFLAGTIIGFKIESYYNKLNYIIPTAIIMIILNSIPIYFLINEYDKMNYFTTINQKTLLYLTIIIMLCIYLINSGFIINKYKQ